jgi:hypothetical protein
MHPSFVSLVVISTPNLQASLRPSTMTHPSCLSCKMIPFPQHQELTFVLVWAKGQGYGWLLGHLSVCFASHILFTLALHFRLDLIQPLTSSLLTCECGHGLDASSTHLTRCPFGGQWITTHDAIRDVMYALVWKSGHFVWRKWWYTFTSGVSLRANFYMIHEDQVFIADVMVTNPTRETMALNVITWLASVATKLSAIAKIRKYTGLQEGHHFIPMAMEVHGAPECDMDCFIKECACLFHNRQSGSHLSLSFCI